MEVLKVSDGSEMAAYVSRPKAGQEKSPAIIVLQEAFGVSSHIKNLCKRFSDLGFVAIAPELFHRTASVGFIGDYNNFASVTPHFQAVTDSHLELDLRATYDFLTQDSQVDKSRIVCSGYCMGGRTAFLAATILPIQAAISYYGSRIPSLLDRVGKIQCPLMLVWGGKDAHIGPEQQIPVAKALREAKKTFIDLEFSDGEHGFFCEDKKSYHEKSAKLSWEFLKSFLFDNLQMNL